VQSYGILATFFSAQLRLVGTSQLLLVMSELTRFLEKLLFIPDGDALPAGTDLTPYYRPWGFTIYRTTYGSSSDEHWHSLLDLIHAGVTSEIMSSNGADQADPVAQQILSLFRLDARSDPEVLDGLGMDEVRKIYQDAIGGEPMNANWKERRVFLLVDEEVIEEQAFMANRFGHKPWIKCVEPYYVASEHVPGNNRNGGQRYFGSMKMRTGSVLQLWSWLEDDWFEKIAPPTIGGAHLVVWDGELDL
jgi:hypothetical protein